MLQYLMQTSTILALLVGYVLPLITAFVARQHWPASVMGPITLTLAGVTGFVAEWAADPHNYDWHKGALNTAGAVAFAIVGHLQSWKDTKLQDELLAFPRKTPPSGVQPGYEPA